MKKAFIIITLIFPFISFGQIDITKRNVKKLFQENSENDFESVEWTVYNNDSTYHTADTIRLFREIPNTEK